MKIEEQVTTVEQSKLLLKLGVHPSRGSMIWRPTYRWDEYAREFIPKTNKMSLSINLPIYEYEKEKALTVPAYTFIDLTLILAELGVEGWSIEDDYRGYRVNGEVRQNLIDPFVDMIEEYYNNK